MAANRRSRKRNNAGSVLNNQLLLILVGVLSAVLVVLLVISGSLLNSNLPEASDNVLNNGSPSASQPSSSETQPSSGVVPPNSSVPPYSSVPPSSIPTTTAPKLPVIPSGGNYINVGSGYIAEVIQVNVETFDGDTYDDFSHPTNNYLPKGTVDYCAKELAYGSGMKYVVLRSGHRVYYDKKVYPFGDGYSKMIEEVKQYSGTLPDHNEIGVASMEIVGHHTVLTLDTLWKAPFYFETNQSGYSNPNAGKDRDYSIVSNNISYVDITFCYATVLEGTLSIPSDHPLFKSAEVIKNESDYTLRLHLRKKGGFYGWHAYYNDQDQLCFQFLNPTKVTTAVNKYGADLTGAYIMIDVGHGGVDGGAAAMCCPTCDVIMMASELKSGKCPTCKTKAETYYSEAELNLNLANALKAELESIGATVVLNRTDNDTPINVNERQEQLLAISPDVCIAIHQNSNDSKSIRGFYSYYYTPWSQLLAKNIYNYTKESGVYNRQFLQWKANYFMNRQTVCPTMLTENGFMSNATDLADMADPEKVEIKASAIAQGIVDYFLKISA